VDWLTPNRFGLIHPQEIKQKIKPHLTTPSPQPL